MAWGPVPELTLGEQSYCKTILLKGRQTTQMTQTRAPTPTEKPAQDHNVPLPKKNLSEGRQAS